ncbi:hypothetical protein [Candidatus Electronema sp. JC]|uniref:hypothetical protein n=1 Tax=Candidatus Electronema sp. JC TaxID=3401570 RepID=UPI003B42B5E7
MKEIINTCRREIKTISMILFTGSCAFILMHWITDQGPGVSPDSTTYIEAARSLLAGNGFFVHGKAMTHYPPGYPLLIGVVDLFYPGDVLQATRFLAAFFFAANLVLFCLAVHICTKRSLVATGCAMLSFLSSAQVISVHSMAWTEAPFVTFSMASFFLFSYHVARPRLYVLVLAGFMAGFAAAIRYVGVVLFPTMALALFLLDNRSVKLKMRDVFIFAGVASLPLAFWLIRNILIAQSATNREFAFHPIGFGHVNSLISTMYNFVLPISISPWTKAIHIAVVVAFFFLGVSIIYRKEYNRQNATSMGIALPVLCVIYSVIYIFFIFISISFFDAHTPLDSRILLPAILALTIAGITLAWSMSEEINRRWIWHCFVFLLLFSVSINESLAVTMAVGIHKNGNGYTSKYWNNSDIIYYLSDIHDGKTIYSNGPDAILFLTGKEAVMIPAKVSAVTRRVNEDYKEEMNQMIKKCSDGKALIVYFNALTWRWYLPSIEEVDATDNLPVLRKYQDGIIYGAP